MPKGNRDPESHRRTSTMLQQRTEAKANGYFWVFYGLGNTRDFGILQARLRALGEKVSRSTIELYNKRYDWPARIAKLDAEREADRERETKDKVNELEKAELALGKGYFSVAAQAMRHLPDKAADMMVSDVVSLTKEGSRLQRLALHQATDRTEFVATFYNSVVRQMVAVFLRVNELTDSEQRKAAYATELDAVMASEVKALEGPK